MTYDNTIYLIGTAEDLRTIHDSLAPELRDRVIDASSDRLVFCTTTRYLPALELVSHLSRQYPKITAAIFFWAEYGECHGFTVYVNGVEEHREVGQDVPGDLDDADAQDEGARVIQDQYRSRIEQYLAMASHLRPGETDRNGFLN